MSSIQIDSAKGDMSTGKLPFSVTGDAVELKLEENKSVIFCGDLNVAHSEIDLANPKTNRKNAGFTDEERAGFCALLEAGFIDTFRHLSPQATGRYSWWSYRAAARQRNIGWRIDYFCTSEALRERIKEADILDQVLGSDHCPIRLKISSWGHQI